MTSRNTDVGDKDEKDEEMESSIQSSVPIQGTPSSLLCKFLRKHRNSIRSNDSSDSNGYDNERETDADNLEDDDKLLMLLLQLLSSLPMNSSERNINSDISVVDWVSDHLFHQDDAFYQSLMLREGTLECASSSLGADLDVDFEWKAGLMLIRLILCNPDRPNQFNFSDSFSRGSYISEENKEKVVRKSARISNLPPHIILHAAIDISLHHHDNGGRNCDIFQQKTDRINSLIIMLASIAINLSAHAISNLWVKLSQQEPQTKSPIRWKRVQSMSMECIALYQRTILQPFSNLILLMNKPTAAHCNAIYNAGTMAHELYCRYLHPSIAALLSIISRYFPSDNCKDNTECNISGIISITGKPSDVYIKIIIAGLVGTATHLSRLLMSIPSSKLSNNVNEDRGLGKERRRWLVEVEKSIVFLLSTTSMWRMEDVWIHPIRCFRYFKSWNRRKRHLQTLTTPGNLVGDGKVMSGDEYNLNNEREEDEESWIDLHAHEHCIRQLTPLICSPEEGTFGMNEGYVEDSHDYHHAHSEKCLSALCEMNSSWDLEGLAFLLVHALGFEDEDEVEGDIPRRYSSFPSVYSPQMMFILCFPHVVTIMEISQKMVMEKSSSLSEEDRNPSPCIEMDVLAARRRDEFVSTAIKVLRALIQNVQHLSPILGGSKHWALAMHLIGRNKRGSINVPSGSVDEGPLSPVRVIQLFINHVINISRSCLASTSWNDEFSKQHSVSSRDVLVLIRNLLSLYLPSDQVRYIGLLVKRCPYPFVTPMLLDLLRPALRLSKDTSQDEDEGNLVCLSILSIISPFVKDMKSHIVTKNITDVEGTSKSCSESKATSNLISGTKSLHGVQKLMQNIEIYSSIISLIRLICMWKPKGGVAIKNFRVSPSLKSDGIFYHELDDALSTFQCFHDTIHSQLQHWSKIKSDDQSSISEPPPPDYYRLNLLEDSLAELWTT